MNVILAVILVSSLILGYAAADLQSIQNANPLNIDLSNPSETGFASSGEPGLDEQKLGGYRPLYPPYFLRDSPQQQQQQQPPQPQQTAGMTAPTYYDKEYYTRGSQYDERLERGLRPSTLAPAQPILPPALKEYARSFPSYQFKADYATQGFLRSSYSYSTFRFPSS